MKKGKLLSVFLLLVIGGLFFSSCEKSECINLEEVLKVKIIEELKEEVKGETLFGTVWKGTDLDSYIGKTKVFDGSGYFGLIVPLFSVKPCHYNS